MRDKAETALINPFVLTPPEELPVNGGLEETIVCERQDLADIENKTGSLFHETSSEESVNSGVEQEP